MSSRAVPADFSILVDELIARFGGSLDAVILYGSCLRSQDAADGVVDFYVVVDDYSRAYPEHHLRHLNAWLAPNVFLSGGIGSGEEVSCKVCGGINGGL